VESISATPSNGRTVVEVRGQVIAPGFIDLHFHGQDAENYAFKAHDGVTTALELEIGVSPLASWYAERTGKALIHFGASSGHVLAPMKVMHDPGDFLPSGDAAHRVATDEEQLSILNVVRQGLDEGAVGSGFGIAYVPTAGRAEILRLFQLAGDRHVPVFVHYAGIGGLGWSDYTASRGHRRRRGRTPGLQGDVIGYWLARIADRRRPNPLPEN